MISIDNVDNLGKNNNDVFNYLHIIKNKELFGKKNLYKTLNVNLYPILYNKNENNILTFFKQIKNILSIKDFSVFFDNYNNYQYYHFLKENNFFSKEELNTLNFYINKKSRTNFYFLINMKKEFLYFYTCSTNDVIKLENELNGNVLVNTSKKDEENNIEVLNPDSDFLKTLFSRFLEFVKRDDENFYFFYSFLRMYFTKNIENKQNTNNDLFKYNSLCFLFKTTMNNENFDTLYKSYKSLFIMNFFCLHGDNNSFWEEFLNPFLKHPNDIFDFHFIPFKKHISNPNIFKIFKIFLKEHNYRTIYSSNKRLKLSILKENDSYYFYHLKDSFGKYLGMFTRQAKKELSDDEFNAFVYSLSSFYTVLDFFHFETEDVFNFLNVLDENHIEILKNNIVLFDDFYSLFKTKSILKFKNKYKTNYFSAFIWSKDLYQKLIQYNSIFKHFKPELTIKELYKSYNFSLLFALINEKDNSFLMLRNRFKTSEELDLFDLKNKIQKNDFSLLKENIIQKQIDIYLNPTDNIDIYFPLFDYFIKYNRKICLINLNVNLFTLIKKHFSISDFIFENLLFSCLDYAYFDEIKQIELNKLEKFSDFLKILNFNEDGNLTLSSKENILNKYSK